MVIQVLDFDSNSENKKTNNIDNESSDKGFKDILSKAVSVKDNNDDLEIQGAIDSFAHDLGLSPCYKEDGHLDIMGMLSETKVKFDEKGLDGLVSSITYLHEKGKITDDDFKKALEWIEKERIALQYRRKLQRKNDEFFKVFERYFRE